MNEYRVISYKKEVVKYCDYVKVLIVEELTLLVTDEEVLAGQPHEDEGHPEPDRGPAPRLVSHHGG